MKKEIAESIAWVLISLFFVVFSLLWLFAWHTNMIVYWSLIAVAHLVLFVMWLRRLIKIVGKGKQNDWI